MAKNLREDVLEPVRIDEFTWYYPYPAYMLLVHEMRDDAGAFLRTDQIKIPWRRVEKSLYLLARAGMSRKKKAA